MDSVPTSPRLVREELVPDTAAVAASEGISSPTGWQLRELKPTHKQVMALLAQGLSREEISKIVGYTPEYVSMLVKQPLCHQYLQGMLHFSEVQLEGLFAASVDAIRDQLAEGTGEQRLKAARLQMEATGRVGHFVSRGDDLGDEVDRLQRLTERLVSLQSRTRERIINGEYHVEVQSEEAQPTAALPGDPEGDRSV